MCPSKNESQCFRIISFQSSVLSVAFSVNRETVVFTDYHGFRRFFAVTCCDHQVQKKIQTAKYPIIRMQFVKIKNENDEDEEEKLFVEDLMGNTFIV